jgi:hypothetical protein
MPSQPAYKIVEDSECKSDFKEEIIERFKELNEQCDIVLRKISTRNKKRT